jgi:hypothetical protein
MDYPPRQFAETRKFATLDALLFMYNTTMGCDSSKVSSDLPENSLRNCNSVIYTEALRGS